MRRILLSFMIFMQFNAPAIAANASDYAVGDPEWCYLKNRGNIPSAIVAAAAAAGGGITGLATQVPDDETAPLVLGISAVVLGMIGAGAGVGNALQAANISDHCVGVPMQEVFHNPAPAPGPAPAPSPGRLAVRTDRGPVDAVSVRAPVDTFDAWLTENPVPAIAHVSGR